MEALKRVFGAAPARTAPPPVETDDVYPVHMLDDTGTLRGIVVTWTLRFNDVLDADKLHTSLLKLLDIGDWRKIGGRLRLKDNGELEMYVPRPFTAERPAATYSHQTLAAGPAGLRAFAARDDAPETLDDFIHHDTPQLSLHITSFNDATLVALSPGPARTNRPGTVVFHHAQSMRTGAAVRNVVVLLGKDHEGGYWMTGVLLPAAWAKFEEEIGKM